MTDREALGAPPPDAVARLVLPAGFRWDDVRAFHGRDVQAVAEQATAEHVRKGLMWRGRPACLILRRRGRRLQAWLDVDAAPGQASEEAVRDGALRLARHLLGLDQPIEAFELAHHAHPALGPVLARQRGLRVPQSASLFEALSWAIIGQQISVAAAVSVRRRFILQVDARHPSGLWCYPDAGQVARLTPEQLRGCGFSLAKADTLLRVADAVAGGELALPAVGEAAAFDAARLAAALARIKGIGPWTVHYTLLRGAAHLDGSLHGDVVVRRGIQRLLGGAEPVTEAQAQQWLAAFAPWRALVAAHLWASQSKAA